MLIHELYLYNFKYTEQHVQVGHHVKLKKTITRDCGKVDPPNQDQWIEIVGQI